MLDQRFTAQNMRKMITAKDFWKNPAISKVTDVIPILERIESDIVNKRFVFSPFRKIQKNGHNVYVASDLYSDFALRKLNDNIKRIFRIAPEDRTKLVSVILSLLNEQTPYYLIKSDLSKFFESIDREKLLKTVLNHALVSSDSRYVLHKLFSDAILASVPGVPRGISLSTTLSEFRLKEFDSNIRRTEGIYFLGRFVDDFVIFCFTHPKQMLDNALEEFPDLSVNRRKTKLMQYGFHPTARCPIKFDFLGYHFHRVRGEVKVSIAAEKIKKFKTKLVKSFWSYSRQPDLHLLEDRIKFLASNYTLDHHGSETPIRSGIFFSYPLATHGEESLVDLDKFLRAQVNAATSVSAKIGVKLERRDRSLLNKYSFRRGFEQRITHAFSPQRINSIRKCWNYA